jgi:hypothetical protein
MLLQCVVTHMTAPNDKHHTHSPHTAPGGHMSLRQPPTYRLPLINTPTKGGAQPVQADTPSCDHSWAPLVQKQSNQEVLPGCVQGSC